MPITVEVLVKDSTTGKNRKFELVAGKNTQHYHKYAIGDKGAPTIASVYVSKDIFAEPKTKKNGK